MWAVTPGKTLIGVPTRLTKAALQSIVFFIGQRHYSIDNDQRSRCQCPALQSGLHAFELLTLGPHSSRLLP